MKNCMYVDDGSRGSQTVWRKDVIAPERRLLLTSKRVIQGTGSLLLSCPVNLFELKSRKCNFLQRLSPFEISPVKKFLTQIYHL